MVDVPSVFPKTMSLLLVPWQFTAQHPTSKKQTSVTKDSQGFIQTAEMASWSHEI